MSRALISTFQEVGPTPQELNVRLNTQLGCEALLRQHLQYGHWLPAERAAALMRDLGMVA